MNPISKMTLTNHLLVINLLQVLCIFCQFGITFQKRGYFDAFCPFFGGEDSGPKVCPFGGQDSEPTCPFFGEQCPFFANHCPFFAEHCPFLMMVGLSLIVVLVVSVLLGMNRKKSKQSTSTKSSG